MKTEIDEKMYTKIADVPGEIIDRFACLERKEMDILCAMTALGRELVGIQSQIDNLWMELNLGNPGYENREMTINKPNKALLVKKHSWEAKVE